MAAARAASGTLQLAIPTVATAPKVDGTINDPVWLQGAKAELTYDRFVHGSAAEPTTTYSLTDGKALFVAFVAKQPRTPVVANQRNNNTGVDTDDEVKVALWPSGKNGINYQFIATPNGTRYQYSTENLAYEPTWDAVGKIDGNGYVITMRIPLSIMRGANQKTWLVNFTRWEVTTGSLYAWSGGPSFQGTPDQNYAEPLLGMPKSAAARAQPRAGVYALGAIAAPSAGGNTSRIGADISVPITSQASFIAALHPDFSNVEADQETIAPTAYRRFYNETRPFFTQGAQYYNVYECDACDSEASLYTYAIPTPRDGYAIEGKQGPLTFAGFDSVGDGRIDAAQSVVFRTPNQHFFASAQRVAVNGTALSLPGPSFRDDTTQFAVKLDDLQHKFIYANYGMESATSNWITDPAQAHFSEIGAGLYGPNGGLYGGIRHIGAQYNPYDGFFTHATGPAGNTTAMDGYGVYYQHLYVPAAGKLKSVNFNVYSDVYHNPLGISKSDFNAQIDLITRSQWEFVANTGSSYFMVNGVTNPVTQESFRINYKPGSATPTSLQYFRGRYGPGYLYSTFRSTTIKVGQRGSLSLEADDTRQYLDNGVLNQQWLERVGFAYEIDPNTSIALGVRRFFGPPPIPNGGSTCFIPTAADPNALGFCPNISVAFHKRLQHSELYVIYGNASQTLTVPQFIVKWIQYVGAEKGT